MYRDDQFSLRDKVGFFQAMSQNFSHNSSDFELSMTFQLVYQLFDYVLLFKI